MKEAEGHSGPGTMFHLQNPEVEIAKKIFTVTLFRQTG